MGTADARPYGGNIKSAQLAVFSVVFRGCLAPSPAFRLHFDVLQADKF